MSPIFDIHLTRDFPTRVKNSAASYRTRYLKWLMSGQSIGGTVPYPVEGLLLLLHKLLVLALGLNVAAIQYNSVLPFCYLDFG